MSEKPTGTEIMLKSMGLGEVLNAAKMFANADTMNKILKFADDVERLNDEIRRLCDRFDRFEASLGLPGDEILARSDAGSGSDAPAGSDDIASVADRAA